MRTRVLAAAIGSALLAAGGVAALTFGPISAGAQTTSTPSTTSATADDGTTTTTTPGTTSTTSRTAAPGAAAANGTCRSNEDPAHEAAESAEREAAEGSGQACGPDGHPGPGGRGRGPNGGSRPNEDPTHEAGESPEREAEENQQASSTTSTTAHS